VHDFVARYSEQIGRQAVRNFLLRRLRDSFVLKICITLWVLSLYVCWSAWNAERPWLAPLAAAVVAIPLFVLVIYAMHWRKTVWRIRRMQVPMSRVSLNEREMSVASELGIATVPWNLVIDIWEFPGLWLLLLSKNYFVTLPTDGVPAAALAFIRAQVAAAHREK